MQATTGADARRFVGTDERGRELEIIAINVVSPTDEQYLLSSTSCHPSQRMTVMSKRTKPKITSERPIGKDVDLQREDVRLPDGTRVTDELVDDIVEEVRRRGGRPSLTGDASVSPRVSFRVTPGVRERADIIAEREGKTISQLAREALEARVRAS